MAVFLAEQYMYKGPDERSSRGTGPTGTIEDRRALCSACFGDTRKARWLSPSMLAAKVVGHVDKRDTVDAIYDGLLRNEPELKQWLENIGISYKACTEMFRFISIL